MANTSIGSVQVGIDVIDSAAQKALDAFSAKAGKATNDTKKLGKEASNSFDEIGKAILKSSTFLDTFSGNLAANLTTKSIDLFKDSISALFQMFVVDGVRGAIEVQNSINTLNIALAQTGLYSEQASKDMLAFTKQMEITSGVAQKIVNTNVALIQSLAQLDTQGLKRATSAALDLHAALAGKGISLEQASTAVAKAATGNITVLKKLGIEVKQGATQAETFANALYALETRFSGAAKAATGTFSGSLAKVEHAYGSFTEAGGNLIVQNEMVISTFAELARVLDEYAEAIDKSAPKTKEEAGGTILFLMDVLAGLTTLFDSLERVSKSAWNALEHSVVVAAASIVKVLNTIGVASDEALETLEYMVSETAKNIAKPFSDDTFFGEVTTSIFRLRNASEQGLNKMVEGSVKATSHLELLNGSIKETSKLTETARKELESFGNALLKQAADPNIRINNRLSEAEDQANLERQILQNQLELQKIDYEEYYTQLAIINANANLLKDQTEDERRAQDIERLKLWQQEMGISDEQYLIAKEQLEEKYRQERLKREYQVAQQQIKIETDLEKKQRQIRESRLQATATMFGALADFAALGGRDMFNATKAFQIAEATTAGYLAVQRAYANPPGPPWTTPIAIATGVQAAANVAKIASVQAPAFAQGGVVGGFVGASMGGDNQIARVRTGEMVLNATQQKNLFDQIGGGGGNVEVLLGQLLGAVKNQPIVVNIGGETVVNTLRSELDNGRKFA